MNKKIGAILLAVALVVGLVLPSGIVIAQDGCDSTCAYSVYAYYQGTEKDGSPVQSSRSNPDDALGSTDHSFFSLGYVDETSGGWIIVEFEEYVGTCLTVVEQSPGIPDDYPLEQAEVYVSADSDNPTHWTYLGIANNQICEDPGTGKSHPNIFDLEECIKFVKIVDITDPTLHGNTADAFDIDSVCAGPCQREKCGELIAGQHIDVGDVNVWDDGTNLYVTYEITEPDWVITETHLYVGKTDPNADKNGNPLTSAPGQFPYDDDDATSVTDTEVTYEIPLTDIDGYHMRLNKKGNPTGVMDADGIPGVVPCNDVYIAAQAEVSIIEEGYTVTDCLVSGADTDDVLYLAEDSLNPGYPLGYTGPYQTYPGTPIPSVLAWTHSSWAPYGVAGAEWISSSYYTENTDYNTWRLFTRSFTFPANATNISGTLTMNCDNAQLVYLNDLYVGEDTYAPGTKIYGDPVPPSGPYHGWSSVESWDVSSELIAGNNELWTMTRNYAWSGGPTANPTGLIYKLCYEYDIPDTVIATETAWGYCETNGGDFPGANWATYMTYHVGGGGGPSG
jgi:hypothetical protein